MMNRTIVFFIASMLVFGFTGFAFAADPIITLPNPLCPGGANSPGCIDSFPVLVAQITSYLFTVIGLLAVVMFIWAGILFLSSAGNPTRIDKAKHALLYAIIGLAISATGTGLIAVIRAVIGN